MLRSLFVLTCMSLALESWAATDDVYWVAVGSFGNLEAAERHLDQIAPKLNELLEVRPATSSVGYRVVAGPYLSSAEADRVRDRARGVGVTDAWVYAAAMDDWPGATSLRSYDGTGDDADYNYDDDYDDDYHYEMTDDSALPRYEPTTRSENAPQTDATEPRGTEPTIVDTAPPGYDLHRLRRSP